MGKDSLDSFLIKTYKISYDLSLYCMKQIDSMFPYIGPEIDHLALCVTFLFLPYFDVIYDLLLNRRTPTWNLFVKYPNSMGLSWVQITTSS